jgi:hypothetical protein
MADMRKCIGSARFGIEAHEAPVTEFPAQPSQKDGLGRMCKTHWNQYTAGLARDAKARKAAEAAGAVAEPVTENAAEPAQTKAPRSRARRSKRPQVEGNQEVADAEPPVGITILSRDEDGFEAVIRR